jgi:dihydroorotase
VSRPDLLIKGGRVIDPANAIDDVRDVAVTRGRITAVERDLPADSARRTVDATGLLVLPGLVDLHAHVYRRFTFVSVDADLIGPQTGVTTWIDAGTAGALTFAGLREDVIRPSQMRIYAFLNISNIGLVGLNWELTTIDYCDLEHFARVQELNRDLIVGAKVRMGTPTIGANGLEPLRRASQAAQEAGLPLMVHIAYAPPPIEEILELLRPGDILTHALTGVTMRIVEDDGRIKGAADRAWDRGVFFDVGHGAGSFSFETAEALAASGRWPHTISTDLHRMSMAGPTGILTSSQGTSIPDFDRDPPLAFHLPLCMSKFLALGMPLVEVVRAATTTPARVVGLEDEVGSLGVGRRADVALFALDEGSFSFGDLYGNTRTGSQDLRHVATLISGRDVAGLLPST